MSLPLPPPGFDELPVDEKIAYVQALWERIANQPEEVHVPESHRRILDERLAETDVAEEPWEVARESLRKELRERRA